MLSDSQMGVFLECVGDEATLKYNVTFEYKFSPEIDALRLRKACNKVLSNYLAFRFGIDNFAGEPLLALSDYPPVIEKVIETTEEEYGKIRDNFATPFVFDGDPLCRHQIYKTEKNVYLLQDIHHLIYDGVSTNVFEKALQFAYLGNDLPKEKMSLLDATISESINKEGSLEFFDNLLAGNEIDSNILADCFTQETHKKNRITKLFDIKDIKAFGQKLGITENVVMLGAFSYALSKYNGQSEVMFTSINNGRRGRNLDNTIGFFVRTFPLLFKIDEESKISDYLAYIKKTYVDVMKHDDASFSTLAEKYGIRSDIKYVYQGELINDFTFDGKKVEKTWLYGDDAISNLDLMITKSEEGYWVSVDYRTDRYTKENIESFLRLYETVLKGFLKAKKLKDLGLVSKEDLEAINKLNETEFKYDKSETPWSLFLQRVKENGSKLAVSYQDKKFTYEELKNICLNLSGYLNGKGIGKGDFVSVLIPRNEFMPITAWGVIGSGAAYQPLDPTYPKDRLNFMVKDSGARMLIADRSLRGLLDEYKGDVLFTDEILKLKAKNDFEPKDETDGGNVIIYTSGTTGMPKGSVLENRNIVCFFHNHMKAIGITRESNVATYASFGFDAGVMDILTTPMSGASLFIIPDDIRLDINGLDEFYIKNQITHGFFTTQVGRMFASNTKCKSIKVVHVGGEKLVPFNPPKDFEFINGYGPSETMAYICWHVVKDSNDLQPIGVPSGNTKLFVFDKYNRLLPIGACGELGISGGQVGRGYLNLPDKNAESFIANPFTKKAGYERLYRTGDVVRLLPTMEFDYVGRKDGQVKIRGFRVELTEIEKVIRDYEGVADASVQAFDLPGGGKGLVAYVVSEGTIDFDVLKKYVGTKKPDYMIPQYIIKLDSIPLNANGKVDKRKLPVPEVSFKEIVKPKNDNQQKIWEKASEVIGNTKFGITTSLFDAGLSSIGVIKLNVALADAFGVSLTIKDFKNNDTIEKIERLIFERKNDSITEEAIDYPLTKNQEGIYIECIKEPESTVYNIPLLLEIDKKIDTEKLIDAIVKAVNANNYLLTTLFTNDSGEILQRKSKELYTSSKVERLKTATDLVRPFKLLGGELFRVAIVEGESHYLFLDIHHIIGDGTSVKILLRDIEKAYSGSVIFPKRYTGYDVALAEKKARQSKDYEEAREHFTKLLSDVDVDFLPGTDRCPKDKKGKGTFDICSDSETFVKVNEFCDKNKLSINSFMQSAFGFALARYNAEDYSVFTTVYNGRNDSRSFESFGMLVKTLPVVVKTDDKPTLDLIKETSEQVLDSMLSDVYSFGEISHDFGINSDVMFIYQGDDFEINSFCGFKARENSLEVEDKKSPLSIQVFAKDKRFIYRTEYDNERFSEALIREFTNAFNTALVEFTRRKKLSQVSLVSDECLARMDSFNKTENAYDESETMASWFEKTAKANASKIAVSCEGRELTYGQIEDLSGRIAAFLNSKGIGAGDFVPVLVNRNENMIICSEGIIRSGAAYEPLDPTYPLDRLKFMMEDAAAKIVIADRDLADIIKDIDTEVLFTDEIDSLPKVNNYKSKAKPNDNFVIIFTSGTTGTPKGNVLAHRNPVALFNYHIRDAKLTNESRTAYFTGFSFDAGMLDMHASLLSGGTLYIIPENIRLDLAALDEFFCKNRITHSSMTTQMGSLFVKNTKCKSLKYFTVGGEKLVPFTPPKSIRFVNGYGPSECTIYSSGYDVCGDWQFQPVGKPLDNLKFYILDKYGNRLPIGAAGELCIAGKQVGLGYHNRPERNAEVFTANPFCKEKGYERMYHTGDVVRELADGNYDFVGRKDGQVKIRGFRVELAEIEQVIREFDGIENTTVQAFDDSKGAKYIVAYLVSKESIDTKALTRFIGESKPSYMIPSNYVMLESIPLTSNGKIDKKALPKPERIETKGMEPADETEETFCNIFAEVLGLPKVYADDDFFTIGGSSITAVQVVVKCDALGFNVVFKNFFENSTPQALARFVKGAVVEDTLAPSGSEKEKYDYSCLEGNVEENLPKISFTDLGDVLLTGVTGFLGAHVYRALMEMTKSKVICLVRSKNDLDANNRFQMIMTYYFEDWLNDTHLNRTVIVDADLSDEDLNKKLKGLSFDTIINNAANVKHFAKKEDLVKDNFESVEHLISLVEKRKAKLIQASSLSVCGESVNGSIPTNFKFKENNLNIGQSLENKYVYSKYLAEQAIIDAISRGRIKGKIIRLGNLAARESDGEFQINASNSGLLKLMEGYIKLGCYPYDAMDAGIEFSPIDKVAEAIVLLAGTPDLFTVFHAKNCNEIQYGYFINALNEKGHKIDIVETEEFEERFKKALNENEDISAFTGFIAYLNRKDSSVTDVMVYNDDEKNSKEQVAKQEYETRVKVASDTAFTTKALYRLGFAWPLISSSYLDNMIEMLDDKLFF